MASSRSPATGSRSSRELALLAEEIKIDEVKAELEAAEGLPTGDEREIRIRRASARIRAVEKAS